MDAEERGAVLRKLAALAILLILGMPLGLCWVKMVPVVGYAFLVAWAVGLVLGSLVTLGLAVEIYRAMRLSKGRILRFPKKR